jgi:hypothetical protein
MFVTTLIEVEEPYVNDKGTTVQRANFETDAGHVVPKWFNDAVLRDLIEFVEAADHVKFDMETMEDLPIELKNYIGKKVAISVSHVKDKNNKVQAQIDNFFSADSVPFDSIKASAAPVQPPPPILPKVASAADYIPEDNKEDDDVPF